MKVKRRKQKMKIERKPVTLNLSLQLSKSNYEFIYLKFLVIFFGGEMVNNYPWQCIQKYVKSGFFAVGQTSRKT